MESTPKKPTEKIGGQLRKKLPKKSVGLADCGNGIGEGISGCRAGLPECQSVSGSADILAVRYSVDAEILQVVDNQAFRFWGYLVQFFSG